MARKSILFIILAIGILGCTTQPASQDYILKGMVEGDIHQLDEITLTSFDDYEKVIPIKKDGSFSEVLQDKGGLYFFNTGSNVKFLYGHDSGTINVTLRQNEDGKWEPYFSGDGAEDIDFIAQINKGITKLYTQKQDVFSSAKLSQAEYIEECDELKDQMYKLVEEVGGLASEPARAAMLRDIDAANLFLYSMYRTLRIMQKRYYAKDGPIQSALNEVDFDSISFDNYMVSALYRQLTHGHWRRKASKKVMKDDINRRVAYNQVVGESVDNEKIRNAMLFYNTKRHLTRIDDADIQNELKTSFLSASTNPLHSEFINNMYAQIVETGKGRPAPMFENYLSHDGDSVSLSDLKGKHVYIDFWATWCAPCKKEFPYLKKIEKKYHDSNIVFVSISLDKESKKDAWRRMVGEEELSGIQLFADNSFNSAFAEAFQVSAIPRFVLIDKEGKIVSANAPRPSDEKGIDKIFKTLDL
jgi:thiol-disulfide isomerase/thioredoxin